MSRPGFLSANPALTRGFDTARDEGGFLGSAPSTSPLRTATDLMTLNGTVNKTMLALVVLVGGAFLGWTTPFTGLVLPAVIVGLVLGVVTAFKPDLAPKTTLPYALIEGFALGGISRIFSNAYGQGIVLTAVALTISITAALLLIYRTGAIKPSRNFTLAVAAGTMGLGLFYLVSFVGGFFGLNLPLINSNSNFGIAFSVVAIVLASANLVLDFDFIEEGSKQGLPKHMEWYGAFGLVVTLVWLYLEILRLLAKLQSRD